MRFFQYKTGVLSGSQFRWFFLGRTVSLFGNAMTPIALAFAILQVKQGQHLLGYILAAEIVPNVLMLLIGGSFADRYRRDRLIIISHLSSALSQSAIATIVLTGANPYLIFPLAIINGVLRAFTSPAMRGIVPEIVAKKYINQANSLLNISSSAAKILGPTVAGILVATVGGGWGITVDAATFFIAALFMSRIRVSSRPIPTEHSLLREMREGWSYFRQRRWIWSITSTFAIINLIQMGVWQVLGPIIAERTFGSAGWGLTLGVRGIGLLMASVAMLRFHLRRPLRDSMLAVAISGIPLVALGQGYALPYLLTSAALAGAGYTIAGIGWDTFLQQAIPGDKLSRVCAFDDFGSFITIPIGELLAVPLAEIFGLKSVATVGGIVFIVAALIPLSQRLIRQATSESFHSLKVEIEDID